jgi:hypothetical protein
MVSKLAHWQAAIPTDTPISMRLNVSCRPVDIIGN